MEMEDGLHDWYFIKKYLHDLSRFEWINGDSIINYEILAGQESRLKIRMSNSPAPIELPISHYSRSVRGRRLDGSSAV